MASKCMKCKVEIAQDIDVYSLFCNECLNGAVKESADRNEAVNSGRIDVLNPTKEERETILRFRKEQRNAVKK